MKDKRFMELVNLYLDGEISEAETTELEREIRSSAGRMDQYRRYCRMQKACLVLARQHRESIPGAHETVVRLPESRQGWLWGQWWRGGVYAGTAAVAATVILVISISGPSAKETEDVAVESAEGAHVVQIPVGEFNRKQAAEPRLASLTDRWKALTRIETVSIPVSQATARTPEFNQTPVITEWPSTSIFPARGPLEFRSGTDSVSGARILRGQPQTPTGDGEVELATFQFER